MDNSIFYLKMRKVRFRNIR